MTRHTLSLTADTYFKIKRIVLKDNFECGTLLLCGRSRHLDPWTGEVEERFVGYKIIEIPTEMFIERTRTHIKWSTTPFFNALKMAEPKDFAVAVIHSHPGGTTEFSSADDVAERETFQIAFDRLSSDRPHLSIVMDGKGNLAARAYGPDLKPRSMELIRVIGDRWKMWHSGFDTQYLTGPEFDRQVRTFGAQSTSDLNKMRIGIVGCGGTGSAVASLLARIGVGKIALFDGDKVEQSNLNRLHFSKKIDANLRRRKVDVVGEGIAEIGLNTEVVTFPFAIDDSRCRDAVLSCDVIFGCTDDHLGRNFLNRIAHFFLIPIIDMGLLIAAKSDGPGYDTFDGRVTVVQPGYPCQVCRGLIDPERLRIESLLRSSPELHEQQRRAGYIPNAPDPSPVVVTFTSELASMAVNELFQRLNGFRGDAGACAERVRRFDEIKDADSVPGGRSRQGCKLCEKRQYDGRGSMQPFLDMT